MAQPTSKSDGLVEFVDQMLFSESTWLSHSFYHKKYINYDLEQLEGVIKQTILTQPYYRNAIEQLRTKINQLRKKNTKSAKKGVKPKSSVLGFRWPNRYKTFLNWFGASLNDPEVLKKVQEIDRELSSIKEDAYVQYYINDKQGIDNYKYLTNQWQPSEEEEEEHKFYKFLAKNFFLGNFLRKEPEMIERDLDILEVLTRPLLRAKARNLFIRMQQTLEEALSRQGTPNRRRSDFEKQQLHNIGFFFGHTLEFDDIYVQALEYAKEAWDLSSEAEGIAGDEANQAALFDDFKKPDKRPLDGKKLGGFLNRWLVPGRTNAQTEEEKKHRMEVTRSFYTSSFLRRVRALKLQFHEISALAAEYKSQPDAIRELSQELQTEVNNINTYFVPLLGGALNDPTVWANVCYFGQCSKNLMQQIYTQRTDRDVDLT